MIRQDISKWRALFKAIASGKVSYRALRAVEKATKKNLLANMLKLAEELSKMEDWEARKAHLAIIEAYTLLVKSRGYVSAMEDRRGSEAYIDRSKLMKLLMLDENIALRLAEMEDLISKGASAKKLMPLVESLLKLIKKRDGGKRVEKASRGAQKV